MVAPVLLCNSSPHVRLQSLDRMTIQREGRSISGFLTQTLALVTAATGNSNVLGVNNVAHAR